MAGPNRGARLLPIADVAFLLMGALFVAAAQADRGAAAANARAQAALVESVVKAAAPDGAGLVVLCCRALEPPDAAGKRWCHAVDLPTGEIAAAPLTERPPHAADSDAHADRVVLLLFEAGSGWHETASAAGAMEAAYGGTEQTLVPWSLPAVGRPRCEDVVPLLPGAGGAP